MIREIIQKGTPILNQISETFDFINEQDKLLDIANDITDTMTYLLSTHEFTKGIGLAASQIGFSKRVFGFAPPRQSIKIYVNPEIIEESNDTDFQFEGCLSFFDFRGRVKRFTNIKLKYFDVAGAVFEDLFIDGNARLIQHEMDHLNGILYAEQMAGEDELVPYEEYLTMKERNWKY